MTLKVFGSMTSTVLPVLFGTYTRSGMLHKGHGTTPDIVFAYTLNAASGRLVGWTSAGGSIRAGCVSAGRSAAVVCCTGGAVQTTAATTATGLRIAITKTVAKKTRTARDLMSPCRAPLAPEAFKLACQLAHPASVLAPPADP